MKDSLGGLSVTTKSAPFSSGTSVRLYCGPQKARRCMDYISHNQRAYDDRALRGARHTKRALPVHLANPLPIMDPEGWMPPSLRGLRVLCLAAGGGLQGILAAAAGAEVTVFDLSPAMLEADREGALEHRLTLRTVQGTMENLSAFGDAHFDLVWQPVSACYIPSVQPMYAEVARVLRPNGLYIVQHKQPASLQADAHPAAGGGWLLRHPYVGQTALPPSPPSPHREADTIEYLHSWTDLLGGLGRAGLVIEAVAEPPQTVEGPWSERCRFLAPYIKIKARKPAGAQEIRLHPS